MKYQDLWCVWGWCQEAFRAPTSGWVGEELVLLWLGRAARPL